MLSVFASSIYIKRAFLVAQGKESACNEGDTSLVPGSGRSSGEGNGNQSSVLAWEIPLAEEPGRLQFMGSQESDTSEGLKNNNLHGKAVCSYVVSSLL